MKQSAYNRNSFGVSMAAYIKVLYLSILVGSVLFIGKPQLIAQQELGTFLQDNAWQVNRLNPAFFPKDQKVVIGLPGIYNDAFISNITIGDLEEKNENGETVLNVNKAIPQLEASNILSSNLSIETVSIGLNIEQWHFSFGHAMNYNALADYPKTLAQLIWEGNSQFIGQEVNFSTDFQVLGYHEWSLGAAYDISKNITIGGRLKYLSGIGDASTDSDRTALSLFTDDVNYNLSLNSDFLVNSSGFVEYNGFSDIVLNSSFGEFNTDQLFSSNNGIAFDLGVDAQFEKWHFTASVLDIGKINWKENVTNYELTGMRDYQGLDLLQNIVDDDTDFPSVLDSLEQIYEPTQTSNQYSTNLQSRAYVHANYQLSERLKIGATFYTGSFRGETYTAAGFGAQSQLTDWLGVGAMYSYRYESFDNLGLNAHFSLGPVQLLVATDNIITAFNVKNANNANFRLGLNLAFGKLESIDTAAKEQDFFR